MKESEVFSVQTVKDIYEAISKLEYRIEGLIHTGSLNIISGDPKIGKSILVTEMAKCLARGEIFLGSYQCHESKVLVVDVDNGPHSIRNRLECLGFEKNEGNFVIHTSPAFKIDNDEKFSSLKGYIVSEKVEVVVLDSLIRIHGKDENSASEMSLIMGRLREISSLGVTVIVIHHSGKSFEGRGNSFRGSQDIIASVDSAYVVRKDKEGLVFQSRYRRDGADDILIHYERLDNPDGTFRLAKVQVLDSKKVNKKDQAKGYILDILKEKSPEWVFVQDTILEIKTKYGIGDKNAREAILELRQEAKVESRRGKNNKEQLRI